MAISFIQYLSMMSPENVNLHKSKLKISSILNLSFNIFYFILSWLYFSLLQKLR